MLDVDAFAAVADLNQDLLAVLVVFHDTDNGVVRSLVQEPRLAAKALVPEAAVLEPVLVLEELEPLAGELEEAAPAFLRLTDTHDMLPLVCQQGAPPIRKARPTAYQLVET